MKKKKKKKLKIKNIIIFGIFIFIIIVFFYNKFNYYVKDISFTGSELIVNLNTKDIECILSTSTPSLNDEWTKGENKTCTLEYSEGIYNLYLKKNDKIYNLSKNDILYLYNNTNSEFYVSTNSKERFFNVIGDLDKLNIKSSDENVAYIDDEGYINTKEEGKSTITYKNESKEYSFTVISSDLIITRDTEFDHDKDTISCNSFSDEEEELLNTMLNSKVQNVGYKSRAAVVEAARFLTLDFPYKIPYFYENGRLTTNDVDAEGRYYHLGLNITDSEKSWGCSIYSKPVKKYSKNGLDCSGFVSWAILNGGYDIGDYGAGFKDGEENDLTDFGDVVDLTSSSLKENNVKVGDLLHSEHAGGHIAMIIGIEDDTYYVAQALWKYAPSELTLGYDDASVQITKYSSKQLIKAFSELVLMDSYYSYDGNLTNMWY